MHPSAIHVAARKGNLEMCRLLVEAYGADIDAEDAYETMSPLVHAAFAKNHDTCILLLNMNADVDRKKNSRRETSLDVLERWQIHTPIYAWLKDRDAARAFARLMHHARNTHKKNCCTDSMLFDINLVAEITSFVTPRDKP
jgi:hypothetical protein